MKYLTYCETKDCPHATVCYRKQPKQNENQLGFEFTFEVNNGRFHCLNERAMPDWSEGYEGEYNG